MSAATLTIASLWNAAVNDDDDDVMYYYKAQLAVAKTKWPKSHYTFCSGRIVGGWDLLRLPTTNQKNPKANKKYSDIAASRGSVSAHPVTTHPPLLSPNEREIYKRSRLC